MPTDVFFNYRWLNSFDLYSFDIYSLRRAWEERYEVWDTLICEDEAPRLKNQIKMGLAI